MHILYRILSASLSIARPSYDCYMRNAHIAAWESEPASAILLFLCCSGGSIITKSTYNYFNDTYDNIY